MHEIKPLLFSELDGISTRTNEIHHDKLYAAYVNKRNEVEQLQQATSNEDLGKANQIFSSWRGIKEGETFAANGMILHEVFFAILGGNGDPAESAIGKAITAQWGSWERFVAEFTATGLAARGWAILAYDPSDAKLHIYGADAQNHGGVWGATPLLPCDVYEHAYVIDDGADRKAYIGIFLKNVDWSKVDEIFQKVAGR